MNTTQSNYAGMTIIQRLVVSGQLEIFKRALKRNKEKARKILEMLKVDQESIEQMLNSKFTFKRDN